MSLDRLLFDIPPARHINQEVVMTAPEHGETPRGHYIRANGLDIYYEAHGQGRPLLLIHGGALTGASWQPYLAAFAAHYRVITPDSRGHGRTANPTGRMSFGLLADDIVALVQALDLRKPLICGYSDGGQVVLEIGMRYPDLPQALVIGGAYIELTEASRTWVRSILGDAQTPEVDSAQFERDNPDFAAMLQQLHGPDGWKTLLQQIKPMWNATLNYTADDFARVVAPTLVLLGDRDGFVPVDEGVAMYRLLPNAELAVVPGAEHTDFIFSPAKVAIVQPLILDFLLRHGA
jgi:pimeloyl-ACP methyl ester carboxylesterase